MFATLTVPRHTAHLSGRPIVLAAGLYAAIGGGIALIGWIADVRRFTDWIGSGISIQPNAALCVFLSGAALLCFVAAWRRLGGFFGAFAALIGLATIFEWISGVNLGIDTVLHFSRDWGNTGVLSLGRMGPPGCTSFTLLGTALFLASTRSIILRRIAAALGLAAMAIGSLSTTSYFYGASVLYTLPRLTVIAFPTATLILVIAAGVIAALPDRQPMRMLLERGAAGTFARSALPLLVVVPMIAGFVRMRGQDAGMFDTGFGSTLRSVFEIAITLGMLWWILGHVKRSEELERKNAERLQGLLGSITDAFYSLDAEWRFVFVNDEIVRRFQRPREQIIGCSIWEMLPEVRGTDADRCLRRAMAERISLDYEAYYAPWKSWFRDRAYPTADGGLAVYSQDATERKAFALAQARLAAIVESSDDAIVSKDLNGVITSWNRGAERLFGYAETEAVGRHISMLIPSDRIDEEPAILGRIRRGEAVNHFETIRRRKDGTLVDVSVTVSPLVDHATGAIVGASKVARDITERKRAADFILRNNQALSLLVQNAPFGVYVVNSDFKIVMINRGSEAGAFANVRPAIGHDFASAMHIIWPPQVADFVIEVFRRTLATGEPFYSKDYIHPRADIDRVESYEWELHPITLPDGTNAVVCYYYDSTSLREAEQAARAARNELRQTLDTAAVGLVHVDRSFRYLGANPAYSEIVGLPADQIVGRHLEDAMGPEAFARFRPYAEIALRGERAECEMEMSWSAAGPKHVHVVFTPWFDAQGAVTGWVASVADITARKRAEDELERHRENLQRLVDERSAQLESSFRRLRAAERLGALGTLAAGLGHDISNLILPLSVRLECLAEADLPDKAREDIDAIAGSIGYLKQLSSSLRLLASSPLDNAAHSQPPATDLDRWCEISTPLFKAIAPKGCILECATRTSGLVAAIDEASLLQAVFNLVQNAAEAISELPEAAKRVIRVEIRTTDHPRSSDESDVLIEVSDTGPGMDEEVQRRCLEPYFTTKRKELSGGLGLALVRQYVEHAGGTISVRSRKGEGTTFSIVLPRGQVAPADGSNTVPSSASTNLRTASVTVSDPRTTALLSWTLRAAGIAAVSVPIESIPLAGLWIVEAQHTEAAVKFAKQSGRVALVIGENNETQGLPDSPNVIFAGKRPTTASLRRAVETLLRSTQPQSGAVP
ncbi:MAG: PAS domain S-box protein [Phycisphaeraceae bacterium]|nr:PAS domain S-box protein [Phycisphaeraceae bacterium]